MTLSTTSAQYGPSLRTRIVIISRHVRSRGVDELKMLLLMPQNGCVREQVYHECPTLPSAQPPPVPGSSCTRVWIQMRLLMPRKFNIPTLKIRPSIAHAMEHNQNTLPPSQTQA